MKYKIGEIFVHEFEEWKNIIITYVYEQKYNNKINIDKSFIQWKRSNMELFEKKNSFLRHKYNSNGTMTYRSLKTYIIKNQCVIDGETYEK